MLTTKEQTILQELEEWIRQESKATNNIERLDVYAAAFIKIQELRTKYSTPNPYPQGKRIDPRL